MTKMVPALALVSLFGALGAGWIGAEEGSALRVGSISGTVTLEPPPPPRRTPNRYGGTRSAIIQQLPAVVYLRGRIGAPPPPDYVANPEMTQRDSAFAPAAVALTVGGTVSFPNRDPFFHNVFSSSGTKRFDLGRYREGESKDVVFDKPGIVEVFCEVHDQMRGAIVVTENPFHAVVSEDGAFRIDGVPPGEYVLVAWHAEHDELERTVTVTEGEDSRIEVELRR